MKFIIVGLGNFGASLAEELTSLGNEVIGIDSSMSKVDACKEKLSHAICMDATDEQTVSGLPLKDTDIVIITIGENQGDNVIATALFKSLEVRRLISRAINSLHEKILQAIGVDEIIHPEQEAAERLVKKLSLNGLLDSFEIGKDYSIVEANIPYEIIGKTIKEVGFRETYNLIVLTTIKRVKVKSLIGKTKSDFQVQGIATPEMVLEENDILVLYGANKDIRSFLKNQ